MVLQENTSSLLNMRANKKLVQQQVSKKAGQIILLKDISNISLKARRGSSRNDIDQVIKVLVEKYGE